VLAACERAPGHEPLRFTLNATTVEALKDEPATQAHVEGALELLFGSPQAPAFLRHDDWEDDFDPNHPELDADDGGSGEFTQPEREQMHTDNLARFAHEIRRIEDGQDPLDRASKVPPSLQRAYLALAKDAPSRSDAKFQEEAKALFADFYPSLADSAELYRQQCLHCHGVEGGGDGPTSGPKDHPFLDPRPRDYRKGIFKFTAVKDKARPRRADLYRVIDQGIYATAMPSFRRFSSTERHGLVDYVRMLAIRGEVENRLVATFKEEEALAPKDVSEAYMDVWEKWNEAKDKVVVFDGEVPAPSPTLIARGDVLFHDAKKGNCASCHGDLGLGDGSSAWKIDETSGKKVPAYKDDWGYDILPRNLRQGLFRGGRRPIDIYRRIYAGINGGPMPGIGEAKDAEGKPVMGDEDMWALVHYVRSLSERDETVYGHEDVRTAQAQGEAHKVSAGVERSAADAPAGNAADGRAADGSDRGTGH
jgi:mono/diheme cytochrome c family protein